jgi:SlyX protein
MSTDTMTQLEQRIADLEIRLTHQEAALEELVRSGFGQQQHIDRLEAELARMRELLRDLATAVPGAGDDESPPPHY